MKFFFLENIDFEKKNQQPMKKSLKIFQLAKRYGIDMALNIKLNVVF